LSLGIEGHADAPAGGRIGSTDVSLWTALGALVPCAYVGPLFGCAIVEGGSLQASSGASGSQARSFTWWGAGGRMGGAVSFGPRLGLRLHADLVANADPYRLGVDGATAWPSWPVITSVGADALVHFP
jgi:hypothetical protein